MNFLTYSFDRQNNVRSIIIFIVIGTLIYGNSLNVPFYLDDIHNLNNSALRIEKFSVDSILQALSGGHLQTRPVSNLSFALNYLLDGFDVQGYHFLNIILHICSSIFLFLLLRATLFLPVNREKYGGFSSIAFLTALLWLVHPVGTQSVTYIVQRMNSMAAMFYLLSMLLYVTGRRYQVMTEQRPQKLKAYALFTGSGLAALLAIGSKEIAATLPVMILMYEWYFFQNLSLAWLRRRLPWVVGAVAIICLLIFFYLHGHLLQVFLNNDCPGRDFTKAERILTQFRVIVHYIELLLYPNPSRLFLDYNFSLSRSLVEPVTTFFSAGFLISTLIAAILLSRKERLLSFCLLWFFGNLVIESSVICLEIIFEHRTYLPSTFFILFVTATLYRISPNNRAISLFLVGITLLFCYWTVERNKVWQRPEIFWKDCVVQYPDKARPHNNLGYALLRNEKLEEAGRQFLFAIELAPEEAAPHNNLGLVFLKTGRTAEAIEQFTTAIQLDPKYYTAYNNLSDIFEKQGKIHDAIAGYQKALEISPENIKSNGSLGKILAQHGHPAKALPYLEKASHQKPIDVTIHLNLGEVLLQLGRKDEAITLFQQVIELDPNSKPARQHLTTLLLEKESHSM
ncbi:MAG: Tfp pilus assembly protein PilF [Desulforhopalus sp.]|jgi:Tfp pilus assembly protein PilF